MTLYDQMLTAIQAHGYTDKRTQNAIGNYTAARR